ncbi:MAG: arsenate reductase ArsC [Spirochaetes bacterium]|nr:arsenate reductase ArsC [Spirochaetota bacterium]
MSKIKVLFVCIHNSARSQMAEAYLKTLGGDRFEVESAGLEPGKLNPNVVKVLKEIDIDISSHQTKSVFDFLKQNKSYHFVITVCDETASERCPIFPGRVTRQHWPFPDPSSFTGSEEEVLAKTREVRDMIKERVENFIVECHKFV